MKGYVSRFSTIATWCIGCIILILCCTSRPVVVDAAASSSIRWTRHARFGILQTKRSLLSLPSSCLWNLRGGEIQEVMTMEQVQEILQQAQNDQRLVVIDFYSTNCPPCQRIAPLYEELSDEFPHVVCLKVNVDTADPTIKETFHIDGWPTFVFIDKDGIHLQEETIVGGTAVEQGLYEMVNKYA